MDKVAFQALEWIMNPYPDSRANVTATPEMLRSANAANARILPFSTDVAVPFEHKLVCILLTVLLCELVFRVALRRIEAMSLFAAASRGPAANRVVAPMHAIVVCALAGTTLIGTLVLENSKSKGETLNRRMESQATSEYAICISIGYFLWDLLSPVGSIIALKYEPMVPLMMHHVLSLMSMAYVAFKLPNGSFYTCILILTEGTVPFGVFIWALEQAKLQASRLYILARYGFLLAWITIRLGACAAFFILVFDDSKDMGKQGIITQETLAYVVGGALLMFNCIGLITYACDGFPWRAKSSAKSGKKD